MPLLDTAENLLKNTALTVLASPTPIEALGEFPPPVVENFWNVIHAATNVVERAAHDELLAKVGDAENVRKLVDLLNRALNLLGDALTRAALSEETLQHQLHQWKANPRLEEVLTQRYFGQIRGFMARIVEYGQHVLDSYGPSPRVRHGRQPPHGCGGAIHRVPAKHRRRYGHALFAAGDRRRSPYVV